MHPTRLLKFHVTVITQHIHQGRAISDRRRTASRSGVNQTPVNFFITLKPLVLLHITLRPHTLTILRWPLDALRLVSGQCPLSILRTIRVLPIHIHPTSTVHPQPQGRPHPRPRRVTHHIVGSLFRYLFRVYDVGLIELREIVASRLLAPPVKSYFLLDTTLLLQRLLHTVLRLERILTGVEPHNR